MKYLLFFFLLSPLAIADDKPVGRWAYFMKVYRGQDMPEGPEDTLRLRYELTAEGKSHLYWWHEGEHDHCHRRGSYTIEEEKIHDQTEWVDPENTPECAKDPDMQENRLTKTPFSFRDGNLMLHLQLGEEEIFYVWRRLAEGEE